MEGDHRGDQVVSLDARQLQPGDPGPLQGTGQQRQRGCDPRVQRLAVALVGRADRLAGGGAVGRVETDDPFGGLAQLPAERAQQAEEPLRPIGRGVAGEGGAVGEIVPVNSDQGQLGGGCGMAHRAWLLGLRREREHGSFAWSVVVGEQAGRPGAAWRLAARVGGWQVVHRDAVPSAVGDAAVGAEGSAGQRRAGAGVLGDRLQHPPERPAEGQQFVRQPDLPPVEAARARRRRRSSPVGTARGARIGTGRHQRPSPAVGRLDARDGRARGAVAADLHDTALRGPGDGR